jgi:hypothetical protein
MAGVGVFYGLTSNISSRPATINVVLFCGCQVSRKKVVVWILRFVIWDFPFGLLFTTGVDSFL